MSQCQAHRHISPSVFTTFLFLALRVSSTARFFRSFSLRCWQAVVENGADDCRKTHVCSLAGHRSWELLLRAPERLSLRARLNETPQPHTNEKKLLFPPNVLCSNVSESRLSVVRRSGPCLLAKKITHQTVYDDENHRIVTLWKCQEDLRVNC